jgi:hypothetical protein
MFNDLTSLGFGIVTLAVIIGVGSVVLYRFGGASATCGTGFTYNTTSDRCWNGTDTATPGGAWTNTNYMNGQLGSSGLAGWTPAVIALAVGLLFLGAFLVGGKKSKGRY